MVTFREVLNFLTLLGVPSLGAIVGYLAKALREQKKEQKRLLQAQKEEQEAIKKGLQAMLRSQMINEYNKWFVNKGYAPIWAKDNFENIWVQYESLGENGVMDKIHEEFMSLPTEPPKKK